jgi:hypothetical protein
MNTTSAAQRFSSFALAAVLTTCMLLAIQNLATSEASPAQLARAAAAASAAS